MSVGVCSWSLRPSGPENLAEKVRATGVSAVQLALDPLRTGAWRTTATVGALESVGARVVSGMMAMQGEDYSTLATIRETGGVRSDAHWPANLEAAGENARLAARLGISLVTFHAGFIPHAPSDPRRPVLLGRVREVVDRFAAEGIGVALETGQECAATLLDALEELDRPEVGVNFDPANMILYGMGDPIPALQSLRSRVAQVHVKDARLTETPGAWGLEVPAGEGEVNWRLFFCLVRKLPHDVDLIIEREAGESRVEDVRTALALISRHHANDGRAGSSAPRLESRHEAAS